MMVAGFTPMVGARVDPVSDHLHGPCAVIETWSIPSSNAMAEPEEGTCGACGRNISRPRKSRRHGGIQLGGAYVKSKCPRMALIAAPSAAPMASTISTATLHPAAGQLAIRPAGHQHFQLRGLSSDGTFLVGLSNSSAPVGYAYRE